MTSRLEYIPGTVRKVRARAFASLVVDWQRAREIISLQITAFCQISKTEGRYLASEVVVSQVKGVEWQVSHRCRQCASQTVSGQRKPPEACVLGDEKIRHRASEVVVVQVKMHQARELGQ